MKRPALAKLLGTLLTEGSAPLSLFSASARAALGPQFAAGILQEERSGAGARVAVRNRAVLAAFAAQLFPSGLNTAPAGDTPRATAVGYYRDAKAAGTTVAEPVLIRAFNNMVFERKGKTLPAATLTGEYGAAAFLLKEPPFWGCGGTLAVVENLEPFLCSRGLPAIATFITASKLCGKLRSSCIIIRGSNNGLQTNYCGRTRSNLSLASRGSQAERDFLAPGEDFRKHQPGDKA